MTKLELTLGLMSICTCHHQLYSVDLHISIISYEILFIYIYRVCNDANLRARTFTSNEHNSKICSYISKENNNIWAEHERKCIRSSLGGDKRNKMCIESVLLVVSLPFHNILGICWNVFIGKILLHLSICMF